MISTSRTSIARRPAAKITPTIVGDSGYCPDEVVPVEDAGGISKLVLRKSMPAR